jgi:ribokinase
MGNRNTKYDVLGIGCNAVDYLCPMERYPIEDEKLQVEDIELQGGGNIATALVAVARLGGRAAYHTVIAEDQNTEWILSNFKREHVDIDHLIIKRGNNPLAFILINRSTGSRTILYSKKKVPGFQPDELHTDLIGRAQVLLVDFYFPEASLRACSIASSLNIPVVIDAEKPSHLADQVLLHCSHVIASRGFALQYCGVDSAVDGDVLLQKFAARLKSPFVCITLGENGALAYDRTTQTNFHQQAFKVDTVDSTGAGDVFHGAFAYFLSQDFTLQKAVEYAAAAAACKCRQIGGRSGIPNRDELELFLQGYSD